MDHGPISSPLALPGQTLHRIQSFKAELFLTHYITGESYLGYFEFSIYQRGFFEFSPIFWSWILMSQFWSISCHYRERFLQNPRSNASHLALPSEASRTFQKIWGGPNKFIWYYSGSCLSIKDLARSTWWGFWGRARTYLEIAGCYATVISGCSLALPGSDGIYSLYQAVSEAFWSCARPLYYGNAPPYY